MNETTLGSTIEAVVKESSRITPESHDEVRQITLQIDDPAFRYLEGQSVGVVVPGPHPFGNQHHVRRYSITDDRASRSDDIIEFSLLVRRCFYLDEISGEKYPGIASNYLCDASTGDKITLTGPYKSPFQIPENTSDNILMIGTGTGIAPFRAFIQHIYKEKNGWEGDVRLFYGAKSGLDLLYMNDINGDLTNYYDEKTFKAYSGLVGHPLSNEEEGLESSIDQHAEEIWSLIQRANTHVFIAGLKKVSDAFDKKMSELAGSEGQWEAMKQNLVKQKRLSELLYN